MEKVIRIQQLDSNKKQNIIQFILKNHVVFEKNDNEFTATVSIHNLSPFLIKQFKKTYFNKQQKTIDRVLNYDYDNIIKKKKKEQQKNQNFYNNLRKNVLMTHPFKYILQTEIQQINPSCLQKQSQSFCQSIQKAIRIEQDQEGYDIKRDEFDEYQCKYLGKKNKCKLWKVNGSNKKKKS